jgi:hypothetical protein
MVMASLMHNKVLRFLFVAAGSVKLTIQAVNRLIVDIVRQTQITPVKALFGLYDIRVRK